MSEIIAEDEACPYEIFESASREVTEGSDSLARPIMGYSTDGNEIGLQGMLWDEQEDEVIEAFPTSATHDVRVYETALSIDNQNFVDTEGQSTTAQSRVDTTQDSTTLAKRPDPAAHQIPRTTYSPPFFAPTFIPGAPFYSLPPPHAPPDLDITAGAIQFSNVTFAYNKTDHQPTLRNISFRISPGENVAIVGLPNSGKSTLLKLLVGVISGHEGRIDIDGVDTRTVSRGSLLSQISVVPQSVCMLNASVFDNVRFGLEVSRQRVEEACRVVGLHDSVMALRSGYDTILGANGVECSRADLQKLSIARVLLMNNRVVLIDAALGALDRLAECHILRYLRGWGASRTVITVAQRLGTITLSDKIYVMFDGMLVDSGTHAQLMARPGLYRRLWEYRDAV